jgi:hypothetical protein
LAKTLFKEEAMDSHAPFDRDIVLRMTSMMLNPFRILTRAFDQE